ncbi:hypothetical protein GYMLUDRAFT_152993 [Collybiopsis luxurians FD-317 M1]|nr:hypothetical protein GYMLUDRAFT_152993 [Collybiopsis luxurians FD-317 M1]
MSRSLPSTFTSLYRLFLRTCSASVLHQNLATRHLRALWRPIFSDAAKVVKRLQTSDISPSERAGLEKWLKDWDERMDHTLSLLYVSATSRGLPHQLTRNLSQLYYSEYARMSKRKYPVWNAQLTPNAREYHPEIVEMTLKKPKAVAKEEKARQAQYLSDCAWNSLGLAIGMAEGRDKVSLGRTEIKGKVWQT